LPGEIDRFRQGHNAELRALVANDPHLSGADFPIDPYERIGRRRMPWRKRAAQIAPFS
jgi:hypothetical protein